MRAGWALLILAVDQGSSSTKGALVDDAGVVHARAEAAVGVDRAGSRVTHDAEELLGSVRRVLAELARAGTPDAVALACQRSTCLLWERDGGRPLTAALSWQDLSAAGRLAALMPRAAEVARRSGLRLSPHYAGPKLALLLDEQPPARRRAEAGAVVAGTLDAFLVHGLTGLPSTEPGHAGRTLLYSLDEDRWDPELCAAFDVPERALPALLPSAAARGVLRGGALDGVPLLVLLGDQQAALVGNGGAGRAATRVAVAHFGTGAFALTGTGAAPLRHEGLLSAVVWSAGDRRFQLEGSVNSAGSAADWAVRLTGADLAAVGAGELEPEALPLVLPGFAGVGTPWWRGRPGATITGLRLTHGPDALLAAVLAGVAQRLVDCLEAFEAAGVPPFTVRASGRLGALPALAGLLADASGVPVEVVAEEEAGLRGAARLAAVALGADEAALDAPPPLRGRREPRWREARRDSLRARWRGFVAAAAELPSAEGPEEA